MDNSAEVEVIEDNDNSESAPAAKRPRLSVAPDKLLKKKILMNEFIEMMKKITVHLNNTSLKKFDEGKKVLERMMFEFNQAKQEFVQECQFWRTQKGRVMQGLQEADRVLQELVQLSQSSNQDHVALLLNNLLVPDYSWLDSILQTIGANQESLAYWNNLKRAIHQWNSSVMFEVPTINGNNNNNMASGFTSNSNGIASHNNSSGGVIHRVTSTAPNSISPMPTIFDVLQEQPTMSPNPSAANICGRPGQQCQQPILPQLLQQPLNQQFRPQSSSANLNPSCPTNQNQSRQSPARNALIRELLFRNTSSNVPPNSQNVVNPNNVTVLRNFFNNNNRLPTDLSNQQTPGLQALQQHQQEMLQGQVQWQRQVLLLQQQKQREQQEIERQRIQQIQQSLSLSAQARQEQRKFPTPPPYSNVFPNFGIQETADGIQLCHYWAPTTINNVNTSTTVISTQNGRVTTSSDAPGTFTVSNSNPHQRHLHHSESEDCILEEEQDPLADVNGLSNTVGALVSEAQLTNNGNGNNKESGNLYHKGNDFEVETTEIIPLDGDSTSTTTTSEESSRVSSSNTEHTSSYQHPQSVLTERRENSTNANRSNEALDLTKSYSTNFPLPPPNQRDSRETPKSTNINSVISKLHTRMHVLDRRNSSSPQNLNNIETENRIVKRRSSENSSGNYSVNRPAAEQYSSPQMASSQSSSKDLSIARSIDTFEDLNFDVNLLRSIRELGLKHPTRAQKEGFSAFLNCKDIVLNACTGSGKTAMVLLGLLQQFSSSTNMSSNIEPSQLPEAIILTPTTDAAHTTKGMFNKFASFLHPSNSRFNAVCVSDIGFEYGQILIGTPPCMKAFIEAQKNQHDSKTRKVRCVIIDNAEQMTGDFLSFAIGVIFSLDKGNAQTVVLTQTLESPGIKYMISFLRSAQIISVPSADILYQLSPSGTTSPPVLSIPERPEPEPMSEESYMISSPPVLSIPEISDSEIPFSNLTPPSSNTSSHRSTPPFSNQPTSASTNVVTPSAVTPGSDSGIFETPMSSTFDLPDPDTATSPSPCASNSATVLDHTENLIESVDSTESPMDTDIISPQGPQVESTSTISIADNVLESQPLSSPTVSASISTLPKTASNQVQQILPPPDFKQFKLFYFEEFEGDEEAMVDTILEIQETIVIGQAYIFCEDSKAEWISEQLKGDIECAVLGPSKSESDQAAILKTFLDGRARALLLSDETAAAFGEQLKKVPLVLNFEFPETEEIFMQRASLTGRNQASIGVDPKKTNKIIFNIVKCQEELNALKQIGQKYDVEISTV